jgi:hypothetical protein
MALGGRAFNGPLPFALGTNSAAVRYGFGGSDLSTASGIGMQYYRNDVPWNINQGGNTPVEGLPGVYSATNITNVSGVVAAVKAAGLKNLLVVTVNQTPALCPTLGITLTSGTGYTSISVTPLAFAIASGNSIQLTNYPTQSQTQTVTATANMSAGASGTLSVSSFTANHTYPGATSTVAGAWVYDTSWVASTPQHFANMMAYLVAQSGLQGLDWELLNEPDGSSWYSTPPLLYQMYALTYPAMKAADPTCTVHGLCIESLSPPGNGNGTDYYNAFVLVTSGTSSNPTGNSYNPVGYLYDITSLHCYCDPLSPDSYASPIYLPAPLWLLMSNFRANMLAKGDTTNIWWTEIGWQNSNSGNMTPQLQAQYYQTFFNTMAGYDPVNKVQYSSYIKVFCQFAMENSGAYWGILGQPAVGILTELITGH